jgi:hypothetical protein
MDGRGLLVMISRLSDTYCSLGSGSITRIFDIAKLPGYHCSLMIYAMTFGLLCDLVRCCLRIGEVCSRVFARCHLSYQGDETEIESNLTAGFV